MSRVKGVEQGVAEYGSEYLEDLGKGLLIRQDSLDEEVVAQPTLFYKVADAEARVTSLRDAAKQEVEETEARLGMKYRRALQSDKKLTERVITEQVYRDPEYLDAMRRYLTLRELTARWQALKAAFEQRASMLKVLGSLYAANYFSTDSLRSSAATRDAATDGLRRAIDVERQRRRKQL